MTPDLERALADAGATPEERSYYAFIDGILTHKPERAKWIEAITERRSMEARIAAQKEEAFVGAALARLAAARARGWDWTLFTSWCSGPESHDVFILRLREPGGAAHAAKTKVGPLEDVLRWGVERVGQNVTVDPRAPAG